MARDFGLAAEVSTHVHLAPGERRQLVRDRSSLGHSRGRQKVHSVRQEARSHRGTRSRPLAKVRTLVVRLARGQRICEFHDTFHVHFEPDFGDRYDSRGLLEPPRRSDSRFRRF